MARRVLIVGGGIAGFTVAKQLRELQCAAAITIVDAEGFPYDRPPLSKEVLTGTADGTWEDSLKGTPPSTPTSVEFVARDWYHGNDVEVLVGTVESIDHAKREVALDSGERVSYTDLVLATGGLPRRGSTPGFNEHVHVLRTFSDAVALREILNGERLNHERLSGQRLNREVHLGIIGAGLIGAEVASSARKLGCEVTLIDPVPVALVPAVGVEVAEHLHSLHAAHGVNFIQGSTTAVNKLEDGYEIVAQGQDAPVTVRVDAVLLCIGLIPDERLPISLGLDCENGVLVDHEQKTSLESVWAVGDCARRRNPDGSLERRHEHWDSALQEGRAAAYSIAGVPIPGESASWFWTDRYGVHVESTGDMFSDGVVVVRREAEGKPQAVFNIGHDGKLLGATSIDDPMAVRAARRIIDRSITVDPEQLKDPSVPLKKLAR